MENEMARLETDKGTAPSRRRFLQWLINSLLIAVFIGALNIVIRYLIPPARAIKTKRLSIAMAQIAVGSSLIVEYRGSPVIIVRSKGGVRAFSAVCTHLGCIVKWSKDEHAFICPCHAGKFDGTTGKVISGPPPEPLAKINFEVEEDTIILV